MASTSQYVCLIWHVHTVEREKEFGRFDIVRSQETLHLANSSLGGLFKNIRDNEYLINPPSEARQPTN